VYYFRYYWIRARVWHRHGPAENPGEAAMHEFLLSVTALGYQLLVGGAVPL
jgi:hypothetical protein